MYAPEFEIVKTERNPLLTSAQFVALLILAMVFQACLAGAAHAQAQNFENLDRLDGFVAASLGANRGEPGGPVAPLDRRLRLAACPQTPVIDAPRWGAATVSCPSIGWRIRVPLVADQSGNKSSNFNGVTEGTRALVVKKGDPVQLMAGGGSFTISRMMIADEDGAVGALIRVRQEPRATPVMARVERIGVVRIPGI